MEGTFDPNITGLKQQALLVGTHHTTPTAVGYSVGCPDRAITAACAIHSHTTSIAVPVVIRQWWTLCACSCSGRDQQLSVHIRRVTGV